MHCMFNGDRYLVIYTVMNDSSINVCKTAIVVYIVVFTLLLGNYTVAR